MSESRGPGRPPGRTEQGEETRQALYDAAIRLFAEHGYEQTTMAAIAREAGVSPGLVYRYFDGKQALALELYRRVSRAYRLESARPGGLPAGSWAERTAHAIRGSLAVLAPYRLVLRGVLPQLLTDSESGLLSPAAVGSRADVFAVYRLAIDGARDAPREALAHDLARIGYLVQLAILLFWILERTPNQRATIELVMLLDTLLPAAALGLWLPGASAIVHRLALLADALVDPPLGTVAREEP